MALKDIFKMTKANRYTADGREELIKAQEAVTEDRRYNIGEISEKTGLQKTANGWVKPKSGKQPGAKNPDESARIAASKEARAKKSQELEQKAAGDFAKYKDLPPVQRKDALGAASHEGISIGMTQRSMEGMGWDLIQADDKVNVYGKPDGSKAIMKHDGKKITEVSYEAPGNKPAAESKSTESVQSAPKAPKPSADDLDWAKGVASRNNVNPNDLIKNGKALKPGVKVSFNTPRDGDLKGEIVDIAGYDGKAFVTVSTPKGNRMISTEKITTDSAPRILTGDTRIRVRK